MAVTTTCVCICNSSLLALLASHLQSSKPSAPSKPSKPSHENTTAAAEER